LAGSLYGAPGASRGSMAALFSDAGGGAGVTLEVIGAGGGGGGPAGVRWVHKYQQQGAWCQTEALFGMFNSEGLESHMGEW
jgi:hypothetical protein